MPQTQSERIGDLGPDTQDDRIGDLGPDTIGDLDITPKASPKVVGPPYAELRSAPQKISEGRKTINYIDSLGQTKTLDITPEIQSKVKNIVRQRENLQSTSPGFALTDNFYRMLGRPATDFFRGLARSGSTLIPTSLPFMKKIKQEYENEYRDGKVILELVDAEMGLDGFTKASEVSLMEKVGDFVGEAGKFASAAKITGALGVKTLVDKVPYLMQAPRIVKRIAELGTEGAVAGFLYGAATGEPNPEKHEIERWLPAAKSAMFMATLNSAVGVPYAVKKMLTPATTAGKIGSVATASGLGAVAGYITEDRPEDRQRRAAESAMIFGLADAGLMGVSLNARKIWDTIKPIPVVAGGLSAFTKLADRAFLPMDSMWRRQGPAGVDLARRVESARNIKEGQEVIHLENLFSTDKAKPGALNFLGSIEERPWHRNPEAQELTRRLDQPVFSDPVKSPDPKITNAINVVRNIYNTIFNQGEAEGLVKRENFITNYFNHSVPVFEDLSKNHDKLKDILLRASSDPTIIAMANKAGVNPLEQSDIIFRSWQNFVKSKKGQRFEDFEDILNYMVQSGQATNLREADALLRKKVLTKEHYFGQLEKERKINIPFWDPDPRRALTEYIDKSLGRINKVKFFGPEIQVNKPGIGLVRQYQYAENIFKHIEKQGGDAQLSEKAFNIVVGKTFYDVSQAERKFLMSMTSMEAAMDLGMSVIQNSTQTLNEFIALGLEPTVAGIKKVLSPMTHAEALDFSKRSASLLQNTIKEFQMSVGVEENFAQKMATRVLDWTQFNRVEMYNRILAANIAREDVALLHDRFLANPGDWLTRRRLREYKIYPSPLLGMLNITQDNLYRAAKYLTNRTQFRAMPQDMPLWAASPYGKLFFQFRNFSINQARFMKRAVWDEYQAGNLEPMRRALFAMPVVGEAVRAVRGGFGLETKDIKFSKAASLGLMQSPLIDRYLTDIAIVGSAGIYMDLFQNATYRQALSGLAGPVLGRVIGRIPEALATGKPLDVAMEIPGSPLGFTPVKQWIRKYIKEQKKGQPRERQASP